MSRPRPARLTRRAVLCIVTFAVLFTLTVTPRAERAPDTLPTPTFQLLEADDGGVRALLPAAALPDTAAATAYFATPADAPLDASVWQGDAPSDAARAIVGDPIVVRGVTITPVSVYRTDPSAFGSDLILDARFDRAGNDAEPIRLSAEGARAIRSLVLNDDDIAIDIVAPVGRLLIVVQDDVQVHNALQPYIQWKRQQGYRVTVAAPDNNAQPGSIKQLIEDEFYSDDPIPLEYVLLVGDHDPSAGIRMVGYKYDNAYFGNETDNWYGSFEGRQPIPDVAIGRFSVRTLTDVMIGVNKTLSYERDGDLGNADWLSHACLTAGSTSGISVEETNQSIRWMFDRHDFVSDTLWFTMPNGGQIAAFIRDQINYGANYVNYRGYYGMDGWTNAMLPALQNNNRLSVVITITCGTGMWGVEETSISEGFFRAGTINEPTGGVACIGTGTTDTHTRFNNVVDAGIFEALLLNNVRSLGWMLNHGKVRLAQGFDSTSDNWGILRFANWNNLIGDPALRMWLHPPVEPTVTHSDYELGADYVDVDVSLPGDWPEMIWATLANGDEVIDSRLLGDDGHVRLYVDDPAAAGNLTLTVVGDDVRPFQTTLTPGDQQGWTLSDVTVDDGGDGLANPNETVTLDLELTNPTDGYLPNATFTVTSSDPRVANLADASFPVPPLGPGESALIEDALTLTVAPWARDGSMLELTAESMAGVRRAIPLQVASWTLAPAMAFAWTDSTGDGRILPGETGEVAVPVTNLGTLGGSTLNATLQIDDPRLTVLNNPVNYPAIEPDSTRDNLASPFQVSLSDDLRPGELIPITVRFEDGAGAVDSVAATLVAADPRVVGATGPDTLSGYWAVDDTDTGLSLAPEYEWIDIVDPWNDTQLSDNYSGGAYDYGEEDESTVMDLPFPFTYYGNVYHRVTINTNGWIALGDARSIILFRNWPIPNPLGPPAMIAPFWDDLHTGEGGVYAAYDDDSNCFVVTWDCKASNTDDQQVFQVILYDPTVYPTTTGNGHIKFQYQDVSVIPSGSTDNDFITVGVEAPDQRSGVEYTYWNMDRPGAENITAGRAILFTDDLSGEFSYSEGTVTPTELDITLVGSEEAFGDLAIENIGDGTLIWVLDPINGNMAPDPLERPGRHSRATITARLDDETPVIAGRSKPDSWGYFWMDETEPGAAYSWVDHPGTVLTEDDLLTGDLGNGYYRGVELPFMFEHYGSYYDSVFVNTNGFLIFRGDQSVQYGTNQNRVLPSRHAPMIDHAAALIAPWWDDHTAEGATISVWTDEQDSVVVTWDGVTGQYTPYGPYTFQAILLRGGRVKLQYAEMDEEHGLSATVGMQNHNATHGLQIAVNEPFIEDELAVLIDRETPWLETTNSYGLLMPGEMDTAGVHILPGALDMGQYAAEVVVRMSDEDDPVWSIPLTISVEGNGEPPVLDPIPNIAVPIAAPLDSVELDPYVVDDIWGPEKMIWTVDGAEDLTVHIFTRELHIERPHILWTGLETLTLTATNPEGLSTSTQMTVQVGNVSVDETASGLPTEFAVSPLYPNPFNPAVTVEVALPARADVQLQVVDVLGRIVEQRLIPGQPAGVHRYSWDGGAQASGVYFVRVVADGHHAVRKAVLMK